MAARIYSRLSQPIGTDLPGPHAVSLIDTFFVSIPLDNDGRSSIHTHTGAEARALLVQLQAAVILHDQYEHAAADVAARLAATAGGA